MATIINGMGKVGIRVSIGPSGGGGGASYLLDTYGGAAAAYSLRKLSSTYSGNAIRVRRSSDNTEQNIGFDGSGNLDTTALTSFVGAGNGFVTTWYDQSGNGKDATQTTGTFQPQIISNGSIITIGGGKPALSCYKKQLNNTQTNASTQATFIGLENSATGNDGIYLLPFTSIGGEGGNIYCGAVGSGNGSSPASGFGSPTYYKNDSLLTATRGALFTAFATGTKAICSIVGGGITTPNRVLQYSFGFSGNYKTFEVIIYNSDQSANRTGINSNINSYYSIY